MPHVVSCLNLSLVGFARGDSRLVSKSGKRPIYASPVGYAYQVAFLRGKIWIYSVALVEASCLDSIAKIVVFPINPDRVGATQHAWLHVDWTQYSKTGSTGPRQIANS